MTQLERIGTAHRVAVHRDACGDPVIPGKNGHLYTDDGAVMVCFTDDGRATPFSSKMFKTKRLQILHEYLVKLKQEGDYEFIAEITDTAEAIRVALFRTLMVKRLRTDSGTDKPIPPGVVRDPSSGRLKRAEIDFPSPGDPQHPPAA
jgi:hypothetical protein